MFGRKKKAPEPIYDVTQKIKKTWRGGTKLVPTCALPGLTDTKSQEKVE